MADPEKVLEGMREHWLNYGNKKYRLPKSDNRTDGERAWDSAVLACSEFVRRLMDYDETIAIQVHRLLSSKKRRR